MQIIPKEKIAHLSPIDREITQAIAVAVCQYYGITLAQLLEKPRHRTEVIRRQMFFYLIIESTELKAHVFAKIFGKWPSNIEYYHREISEKKGIYRQILGTLEEISAIADNLPKKHTWHIPPHTLQPLKAQ